MWRAAPWLFPRDTGHGASGLRGEPTGTQTGRAWNLKNPVLTELGKCFSEQSLLSIYRPALRPLGQQNPCVTQWVPSPKPESKLPWASLAGEKEETISDESSMGIYSSTFERSWGWISVKTSDLRASATRLGSLQGSVKM